MDRAYRLKNGRDRSGGVELVDGDWLRRVGVVAAKAERFICTVPSCGIELSAYFSTLKKKDGTDRRCFFGARSGLHIGHGDPVRADTPPDCQAGVRPDSLLPSVWRDVRGRGAQPPSSHTTEPVGVDQSVVRVHGGRTGKLAEKTVSKFRVLVEHWLRTQPGARSEPFRMVESGAKTWGELFQRSDSTILLEEQDRRVWTGYLERRSEVYGRWYIRLYLNGPEPDTHLTVKIDFDAQARLDQPELYRLVKRSETFDDVYAYVLGCRDLTSGKVIVSSADHFWLVRDDRTTLRLAT